MIRHVNSAIRVLFIQFISRRNSDLGVSCTLGTKTTDLLFSRHRVSQINKK